MAIAIDCKRATAPAEKRCPKEFVPTLEASGIAFDACLCVVRTLLIGAAAPKEETVDDSDCSQRQRQRTFTSPTSAADGNLIVVPHRFEPPPLPSWV